MTTEAYRGLRPPGRQTLVIAQMLLYLNAVFGLIFGTYTVIAFGWTIAVISLLAMAAGAFGIANEKRWGYIVGIVAAGVQLAALLLLVVEVGFNINVLISLLFDGALVALLVHPQSREYQKVWFR